MRKLGALSICFLLIFVLTGCKSDDSVTSKVTMNGFEKLCVQYEDFNFSLKDRGTQSTSNCTTNKEIANQILEIVNKIDVKKGDKKTLEGYVKQVATGDGYPSDALVIWLEGTEGVPTYVVVAFKDGRFIHSKNEGTELTLISTELHLEKVEDLISILEIK